MLSQEQINWLEREARRTFNLTPRRAQALLLMLTSPEGFSFTEIGRQVKMTPEGISVAAEKFQNAGLIRLRRRPTAEGYHPWSAVPGPHLQVLLEVQAPTPRTAVG
jgi:hypothetical protein